MAIKQWITYAGTTSKSFVVYISGSGTYNAPERDVSKVSVPGRNGDIVLDHRRYKNIDIKYPAFIAEDFSANMELFRNYMLRLTGYQRLEDTYHPDEFRLARYKGGLEVKTVRSLVAGEFDITFDAKPQRFLKTGETVQEFTQSGTITNPTGMVALPLVRAYGTGTLTIGSVSVTITAADGYTDIDCETQEAYKGNYNCNANIMLNNGEFPYLAAGENEVTIDELSQVDIVPRWWIL